MLETDDIDDDYFTPIPSTSLANIFTNKDRSQNIEGTGNDSLKYTPPKTINVAKPTVESKATDCLLACVLFAYEWLGENYVAKGKIGLAIVRNSKNNNHDVILYDSNKRTLSCATVTSHLDVTIKGGHYVSYYDNFKKYWTLYATDEEVRKISVLLNSLNVEVKISLHNAEGLPEPGRTGYEKNEIETVDLESKESDTDSTINTKTKMSILSRMAHMGQSVLPRKTITADVTSDSSDNENMQSKTLKHKSTKGIVKKTLVKCQPVSEIHATPETIVPTLLPQSSTTVPLHKFATGEQLTPLDNSSIAFTISSGNDMNMLMSEQRMCNSELRINMGRLTDKMDEMLNIVKDLENSNNSKNNTSYNTEVDLYKKLVSQYEYKIKTYEDMLFKDTNNDVIRNQEFLNEIQDIKQTASESKNSEIYSLKQELANLKYEQDKLISINNVLRAEVANLKKNLKSKEEELLNISKTTAPNYSITENSSDIEQNLKSVMNETFRTISAHLESDATYSGSTIKSLIAAIIKKVTLNSIKE